jgi:hypothetical protein
MTFTPVRPSKQLGAQFFNSAMDGKVYRDTSFRGPERQLVNNVYQPYHNGVFQDCLFWPIRFHKPGAYKATWTKWNIRLYDVAGMLIEHCDFRGFEPEHKVYLNIYGDLIFVNNRLRNAYSQALQTTFRATAHHGTTETSNPAAVKDSGKMLIANNLVVNCGHTGRHYDRGIARSGFALSQHRCIEGMEVRYHSNRLVQHGTGPIKTSAGTLAHSFGAIMCQGKAYSEGIGNVIDYKQPSDRPVVQLDSNKADYWEGNVFVKGGKVKFLNPKNVVWKNNTGSGVVMHDRKALGPISGHYEFVNGVRTR